MYIQYVVQVIFHFPYMGFVPTCMSTPHLLESEAVAGLPRTGVLDYCKSTMWC